MNVRSAAFSTSAFCGYVLCACSDTAQSPRDMARDSAGVTIVEQSDVSDTAGTAWRINETPVLSIGVLDGPPELRFYRITGVVRLNDGSIVVADGSEEIRFYDSSGKHIRSVGREGAGPGEYGSISLLRRYGPDSLVVWDEPLKRGTLIGKDGGLGRVFAGPQVAESSYFFLDAFDDGSLLGMAGAGITYTDTTRTEVRRSEATYFRYNSLGQLDTIGRFFSSESFINTRGGMTVISMPFGFRAIVAAQGDQMHYGSSESYEIDTYDSTGTLRRILRLNRASRRVTPDIIEAFVERAVSRQKDDDAKKQMREQYQDVPYHETLPAFSALKVDAESNLWVADYALPGEPISRWTIFDPDGNTVGSVTTPPRFTLYEISSDQLLGTMRDSMDIERVVLLRLMKPPFPRTRGAL